MNPVQPPQIGAPSAFGVTPVRPAAASHAPAGFWIRFLATMIDGIICGIANYPIQFAVGAALGVRQVTNPNDIGPAFFLAQGLSIVSSFAIAAVYFGYFYSKKGASPGKMAMGLRVMSVSDGTNLSVGTAIMRETIGKALSGITLAIGFIMAAFRADKRALHDLLAGSQVIKSRREGA